MTTLAEFPVSTPEFNDDATAMQAAEEVKGGFEAAEHAMGNLVAQLAPGIEEERWSAVLGDDRKGRLPALVIGDMMNRWATEHGESKPGRLFIAGGRLGNEAAASGITLEAATQQKAANLHEYAAHIKPQLGERTLVVTEHVRTDGIIPVVEALRDNGIPFDLAIVEARGTAEEHKAGWQERYPGLFDGAEVYVGQDAVHYPVFGEEDIINGLGRAAGVKRAGLEPVATVDETHRAHVAAAREEAAHMADTFYNKYLS